MMRALLLIAACLLGVTASCHHGAGIAPTSVIPPSFALVPDAQPQLVSVPTPPPPPRKEYVSCSFGKTQVPGRWLWQDRWVWGRPYCISLRPGVRYVAPQYAEGRYLSAYLTQECEQTSPPDFDTKQEPVPARTLDCLPVTDETEKSCSAMEIWVPGRVEWQNGWHWARGHCAAYFASTFMEGGERHGLYHRTFWQAQMLPKTGPSNPSAPPAIRRKLSLLKVERPETAMQVVETAPPKLPPTEIAASCGQGRLWVPGRWEWDNSWYWAIGYCAFDTGATLMEGYYEVQKMVLYRAHFGAPTASPSWPFRNPEHANYLESISLKPGMEKHASVIVSEDLPAQSPCYQNRSFVPGRWEWTKEKGPWSWVPGYCSSRLCAGPKFRFDAKTKRGKFEPLYCPPLSGTGVREDKPSINK